MKNVADDIERVLITEDEIKAMISRLGEEISRDYADKNPLVISVLRGAFIFTGDLMRAITVPCAVDFMAVSSYGGGTKSSGVVRIVKDLDTQIEGRHIIIAEDILDSGLTLSYLIKLLQARNPESISIATFAVKDIPGHTPAVKPDYVGCHVPDEFIVGYGLDYDEEYRNLPFVGVLKPEIYAK